MGRKVCTSNEWLGSRCPLPYRRNYSSDQWLVSNGQRNYRIDTALRVAQKVFENAEFTLSPEESFLGIRLREDKNPPCGFSVRVDLGSNGILYSDKKYEASSGKLADLLGADERLGKFVLVKDIPITGRIGDLHNGRC